MPWALGACAAAALLAPLAAQVYRGGTDIVVLNVTVTDVNNQFLHDLVQRDFQVFEDGVAQRISNFTHVPQPIALSILIDTSTSMDVKLPIAQLAAIGFVDRLGPHDVAQVMAFSSSINILQTFTTDHAALDDAIGRTRAGGSTSLYEAIYTAVDELKRSHAADAGTIRRQAIILVSDGEDTSSHLDFDTVSDAVKRSDAVVYAIGLRTKHDAPRVGFDESGFALRTFAQESGGRAYEVDNVAQLGGIYQHVADELANQYVIGYTSNNPKRDGTWRRIDVRVARPDIIARTRTGYFASKGS